MTKLTNKIIGKYKGNFNHKKGESLFNLKIFKYNPKTKLFLAECNDEFGNSSIIGAIDFSFNTIKFDKYYLIENYPFVLDNYKEGLFYENMFRKIFFVGSFTGERLHFGGDYFYPGVSESSGDWNMIKV
jgi:hypothetical protein